LLDRLNEIVESNLQDAQFGVTELASEVGLSKSQLNRRLQALTSQSASQFIREYRLKKAMELLQSKAATPTEVAYKVGFSSASYFSTCFKDFYGYSPNMVKIQTGLNRKESKGFYIRAFLMTLSIAILLLLTYSLSSYLTVFKSEANLYRDKSIAVLQFENLSPSGDFENFGKKVTGSVNLQLSKIEDLEVTSNRSTMKYTILNMTIPEIAQELGVSYILDGNVQIEDDSVRISIYLIDALIDQSIWTKEFNRAFNGILELQTEIALKISEELNIQLTPEEKLEVADHGTELVEAHELLWEARIRHSRSLRDTSVISLLQKAIKLDPSFAEAYTELAWMHFFKGFITGDPSTPNLVNDLLDKSIFIDSTNSDNYVIKGALDLYWLNNLESARINAKKAVQLSNWPKKPINYCMCLAIGTEIAYGNLEDASKWAKHSRQIDPANILVFIDEGLINLLKGNDEEAVHWFNRPLDYRNTSYFNFYSGFGYFHTEQYDSALSRFEFAYQDSLYSSMHENIIAYLSNTQYKMGNIEKSNYYKEVLLKRQARGVFHTSLPLAMIAAARKDEEETIMHLHEAYNNKDKAFAYFVHIDPIFDWLEENPEFQELVGRQGFDEKEQDKNILSQVYP
jgi:TolB-like protein/AraC-like DNA-binding protein